MLQPVLRNIYQIHADIPLGQILPSCSEVSILFLDCFLGLSSADLQTELYNGERGDLFSVNSAQGYEGCDVVVNHVDLFTFYF